MSDIIIGKITESLNNKLDKPVGVSDTDIDYVIRTQRPTAENNYTWYRLYRSGWVEQGGEIPVKSSSYTPTISYPITMLDAKYYLNVTIKRNSSSSAVCYYFGYSKTQTGFTTYVSADSEEVQWEVKGFAANV